MDNSIRNQLLFMIINEQNLECTDRFLISKLTEFIIIRNAGDDKDTALPGNQEPVNHQMTAAATV